MLPFNTLLKILHVVVFIQSCDARSQLEKVNGKLGQKQGAYSCSDLGALSYLAQMSVIVYNDFNTNAGTDNITLVCGLLTNSNSAEFATKLKPNQIDSFVPALSVSDVLPGSPLTVYSGSVFMGIDSTLITKTRDKQYLVDGNRLINLKSTNPSVTVASHPWLGNFCLDLENQLNALSQVLSSITANNPPPVVPKGSPGPVIFNTKAIDSNGFAIFYVKDGNSVFNNTNTQEIRLNLNSINPSLILINVAGLSIDFNYGNFVGSFLNDGVRSRVLFNFYEASQMNFHRSFSSNILAPGANIQTDVTIFGSVIVSTLTTTAVIHGPTLKMPKCAPFTSIESIFGGFS